MTKVHNNQRKSVEVVLSWAGQVLQVYHFSNNQNVVIGPQKDVEIPIGIIESAHELIRYENEPVVILGSEMKLRILKNDAVSNHSEGSFPLDESDVFILSLKNNVELKISLIDKSAIAPLSTPFFFEAREIIGLVLSLFIALIFYWLVNYVKTQFLQDTMIDSRESQIVFEPLPAIKIIRADEVAALQNEEPAPQEAKEAKKDEGQTAKKKAVVKKTGLLAAFGELAKNKLDKLNNNANSAIGAGEQAGSKSGTSNNSLGQVKSDSGASANSTGIGGVGTTGRSSGSNSYAVAGSGKGRYKISAGGSEEAFVGTIDKEAVRRVVRSALNQFKTCYEREYRLDNTLQGKIVVSWEIHANGVSKNENVVRSKSTMSNAKVEDCVKSKISGLKFPEPPNGSAVEVTYPFVFVNDKFTQGGE